MPIIGSKAGVAAAAYGMLSPAGLDLPIKTNLAQWYDAADAATFTFSSGNVVSQWNDKSGNARHMSQGTVANQPTLVSNAQNGLPVVRFDATDDRMACTAYTSLNNQTVFVAFKIPSAVTTTRESMLLSGQNAGNTAAESGWIWLGGGYSEWTNERIVWGSVVGSVYGVAYTAADLPIGAYQMNLTLASYAASGRLNRANITLTNSSSGGFAAGRQPNGYYRLGASFGGATLNADICEIIVYSTNLSTTDRDLVETYLNKKWAL